jgi:uncharacterized protein
MTPDRAWSTQSYAVVTGASSGIGVELARGLAARGHALVLVARRKDRLEHLAHELRSRAGVCVDIRECDLANRAQRASLTRELASRNVSVLCNNAGFPICGAVLDNDPAWEAAEVEVNVVAMHELTLAVLPGMVARRSGTILVTGSNAGEQPVPTAATYASTKAFANAFAEALHEELLGTGVTCTLLEPGPVRTEFTSVGGIKDSEKRLWMGWKSPESVAAAAIKAMEHGRRTVIPGPLAKLQAYGGRYLPRTLLFPIVKKVILPALRARNDSATTRTGAK